MPHPACIKSPSGAISNAAAKRLNCRCRTSFPRIAAPVLNRRYAGKTRHRSVVRLGSKVKGFRGAERPLQVSTKIFDWDGPASPDGVKSLRAPLERKPSCRWITISVAVSLGMRWRISRARHSGTKSGGNARHRRPERTSSARCGEPELDGKRGACPDTQPDIAERAALSLAKSFAE